MKEHLIKDKDFMTFLNRFHVSNNTGYLFTTYYYKEFKIEITLFNPTKIGKPTAYEISCQHQVGMTEYFYMTGEEISNIMFTFKLVKVLE